MNNVAQEYGTALFMLASEEDKVAEYREGLAVFKKAFTDEPDYISFISSPGVPLTQRLQSITTVFSGYTNENVLNFILLLCEKNRLQCFSEAETTFEALYDASKRILNVTVKSAVALSEDQKSKLEAKLEKNYKCKIDAKYVVDSSLLGGVIIEADDNVIDGSLRHRMQKIKDVISR